LRSENTFTVAPTFSRMLKKGFPSCHPERSEGSLHLFSCKYGDASLRSA
jgi:hypothetical protein